MLLLLNYKGNKTFNDILLLQYLKYDYVLFLSYIYILHVF